MEIVVETVAAIVVEIGAEIGVRISVAMGVKSLMCVSLCSGYWITTVT